MTCSGDSILSQLMQDALPIYTDEVLIRQIVDDDSDAFTLLYRRHSDDLLLTANRALRDKSAAADMVQDIFLSLWNRRKEIQITGTVRTYLHTAVRYHCLHYIEKNITRHDYLSRLAETVEEFVSDNIIEELQLKELRQVLHEVISHLPIRMQEVYKLSRDENLTHKEIAERLSISVETVKKHIQHALQQIKSALISHVLISIVFILRNYF